MTVVAAVTIKAMTIADYEAVIDLWRTADGVGLSSADERPAIAAYLERNPGLSFTAWQGDWLVGAVLAGHDGRRGYLHHLAVRESHRGQGIGRALAACCEQALAQAGIEKTHLFVYLHNTGGRAFWQREGWQARDDLLIMSKDMPEGAK